MQDDLRKSVTCQSLILVEETRPEPENTRKIMILNEFELDEFKTKNIRVRPDSSVSKGHHLMDEKSEHQSRHMQGAEADLEDASVSSTKMSCSIFKSYASTKKTLASSGREKAGGARKGRKKKKKCEINVIAL